MSFGRFESLDSLRGCAALVVIVYHLEQVKLFPSLMPRGYLAVDVFFWLSGVVIAGAYGNRLACGDMSLREFWLRRCVRIYPLAILGCILGALVLVAKLIFFPAKVDGFSHVVWAIVFNFALLPTPFSGAKTHFELFPINGPLWSLFYELVANLFWAAFVVAGAARFFPALFLMSGGLYAVGIFEFGSANVGWSEETAYFGLARVCFGFIGGVLLAGWTPRLFSRMGFPVLLGCLAVAISMMSIRGGGAYYDCLVVFIFAPLLVCILMNVRCGIWSEALGELSYPLYVLHFPILLVGSGVAQLKGGGQFFGVITLIAACFAAYFANFWYDKPIRCRLSKALL